MYFLVRYSTASPSKDMPPDIPPEQIRQAAKEGIIDKRVIALGGIDEDNILQVKDYGFGGAAILGGLWNKFDPNHDYNYQNLIEHFRKLKRLAD